MTAINFVNLKTKNNKNYAEVVFIGDVHYGAQCCDVKRFRKMVDYCARKNLYVFFMGDLIECGTRLSVGASVYEQTPPEEQFYSFLSEINRLLDKKLIIGAIGGNHEDRIRKLTGFDIGKIMAREGKYKYLGRAGWSCFCVGSEKYSIYTLHGSSGARLVHTKLKSIIDISHSFNADLIAMGHVHDCIDTSIIVQSLSNNGRQLIEKKKFLVVTGHYMKYDGSYAADLGLAISKLGSPKLKFFADKHDIHISW